MKKLLILILILAVAWGGYLAYTKFFPKKVEISKKECKPTGCSGQVCADEEMITTCEYRSEYACYKSANCERQTSGECGWTQTPELSLCLKEAKGE